MLLFLVFVRVPGRLFSIKWRCGLVGCGGGIGIGIVDVGSGGVGGSKVLWIELGVGVFFGVGGGFVGGRFGGIDSFQ